MPEAVGGKGRELILVASSGTSAAAPVDEDDRKAAARETTPRKSPLVPGFDGQREEGVARDATWRQRAGGATEVFELWSRKDEEKKVEEF